MIATFFYRLPNDLTLYHGKYVGPCPVYEEGLDRALLAILAPVFESVCGAVDGLHLGVIAVDRESKDYYSEEEKHVFDLLYCKWPTMPDELFYQGMARRM